MSREQVGEQAYKKKRDTEEIAIVDEMAANKRADGNVLHLLLQ